MSSFTARITGDQQVKLGFQTFVNGIVPVTREGVHKAMERAVALSPGWLGGDSYIVEPPEGSSYQRTGGLGASVRIDQDGLSTRIITDTYGKDGNKYDVYVIGDSEGQGQAWMHVGRWPLERDVVDSEIQAYTTPGQGGDADLTALARGAGI